MKLTEPNMVQDESLSNHAVLALRCSTCPLPAPRMCFGIATGFGGGVTGKCEHLGPCDEDPECTHPDAKGS